MMNLSTLKRLACLSAAAAALIVLGGSFSEVNAQRDPFTKPSFMKTRKPATGSATGTSTGPSTGKAVKVAPLPVNYGPPPVEARIEYYMRLRNAAAANGETLPKVTSVLTLSEMTVSGIFKTPRGWAAMIEATPIKLSYAIYPGEKFFDGQLVAIEENRLVFRKVTKTGEGKFVASVENKPLRQYSTKSQLEGTASTSQPAAPQQNVAAAESATVKQPMIVPATAASRPQANPFLSPVDEMNSLPPTDTAKESAKKPTKIAKNKRP